MLHLLEALQHALPREVAQLVALLVARLLPIIGFSPLFAGQSAPARYRIGLSLILSVTLLPTFLPDFPGELPTPRFLLLLAKEALIGMTIAVMLRLLFELVAALGSFIDLARGATMANVLDPQTRQQGSVLQVFFLNLFLAIFFTAGGHRVLIGALGESYLAVLPWEAGSPQLLGNGAAFLLIALMVKLFLVAMQLAMPVIVVMFLTDVALGLVNQVAPKIQVFFLSMTIKATLGILILFLIFGVTVEAFVTRSFEGVRAFSEGF